MDKKELEKDLKRTAVTLSTDEIVKRYGSANAEFIKGYTGVDNQTGQVFAKGLRDVAKSKINPEYAQNNIKQQAGYSAEIAATSRDNAEAIINKSAIRTTRSDDLAQYGRNHNVVDRVQILDGRIIEGTETQMKFVGNRDQLFKDIAKPDGKFSRYRGVKLELPSEQVEGTAEHCLKKSSQLLKQADIVEKQGKPAVANKLREEARNYKELADNIKDSGLTTEQAINYRLNPLKATVTDIAKTSHRAGVEGAQIGAVIGGGISLVQNIFFVAQGEKELEDAIMEVTKATAISAGTAYSTAAVSSAIGGALKQSSTASLRGLANTSAPTMAVNVCLSLASSIKRYATNEIDGVEFLEEIGEKGASMLASSMMATASTAAALSLSLAPAAVAAAPLIGGLIGFTLAQVFYQSVLGAVKDAKLAKENYERVKQAEEYLRKKIAEERKLFSEFINNEMRAIKSEAQMLFDTIDTISGDLDSFSSQIHQFSNLLGKELAFKTQGEFDGFMLHSNDSFKL